MSIRNFSCRHQNFFNDYQNTLGLMTQPSTPQDFRFQSIKQKQSQIRMISKLEPQTEQYYQNQTVNQKFQSYRSFTDLMQYEIKALIQAEEKVEENERKQFENFISKYQKNLNTYCQNIFGMGFSPENFALIFGQRELSYGDTDLDKILFHNIQLISLQQKRKIKQEITKYKLLKKFLEIIGKKLSNQLNFQIILIIYSLLKVKAQENSQKSTIDFQQLAEQFFYDHRIKYINFRYTKIDTQNQTLKTEFQEFIYKFLGVIEEILQKQQDQKSQKSKSKKGSDQLINTFNIKRCALYSSKDDFLRSDSENDEYEGNIIMRAKRIHRNDDDFD